MTIARKLWLGFGILVLLFVLTGLVVGTSVRSVQEALAEIVKVEEPTAETAYEMEINAVEISRNVLNYLETGDPEMRERARNDRADFEEFKARYDELIDTPTGAEQGERIRAAYDEYAALGDSLMNEKDRMDDLLLELDGDFEAMDEIVDEGLAVDRAELDKLRVLTEVDSGISGTNNSLVDYIQDPEEEYRGDLVGNIAEVRGNISSYRDLDLTPEEDVRTQDLEVRFEERALKLHEVLILRSSIL